jgi:hypothetical protein
MREENLRLNNGYTIFGSVRILWRYQRGNQKTYIKDGQTMKWPKEKRTKRQTVTYKTLHRNLENKGNNKITEPRTISQRESQNS